MTWPCQSSCRSENMWIGTAPCDATRCRSSFTRNWPPAAIMAGTRTGKCPGKSPGRLPKTNRKKPLKMVVSVGISFLRGLFSGAFAVIFREGIWQKSVIVFSFTYWIHTRPGREGLEMVQFVWRTIFHWAHHFPQRGLWEGRGGAFAMLLSAVRD